MSETPHVPPSPPPPGGSYTPPPPPTSPPPGGAPSTDRTIFLVLAYLGILSLIPLIAKKDDPEIQWHAKNGVALFIAELIWVAIRIATQISSAMNSATPFIAELIWVAIRIALIFIRIPFVGCGLRMKIKAMRIATQISSA